MLMKDVNTNLNINNQDSQEELISSNKNNSNIENKKETSSKAETNAEVNDFKDKYLRTLAELENIKKYSTKQLEEANSYAISKFAKEILTVMDIFNKALDSVNEDQVVDNSFKAFISGIKLTKQELIKIITKFDIISLDKTLVGQKFDPNYHEALMFKEEKDKEDNTIFTVFESGYKIKDKLLRPAKVGIIKNT